MKEETNCLLLFNSDFHFQTERTVKIEIYIKRDFM